MPLSNRLTGTLQDFILRQPMFFVATAAPEGRVNVSPKGADSLRIKGDRHIRWLNLSGSGNETAGHLRLSNRMTLMFCAFEGNALILRVYGQAEVLHPGDAGWAAAARDFPPMAGSRQIFDLAIDSVQTSCGTGVPLMVFEGQRAGTELVPFYDDMGPDGVRDYWRRKNSQTIDGYPTGIASEP